jgi:hypothetical protein
MKAQFLGQLQEVVHIATTVLEMVKVE